MLIKTKSFGRTIPLIGQIFDLCLPAAKRHILSSTWHRYAATDAAVVDTFNAGDAFSALVAAAGRVGEQHAEMPAADLTAMHIALAHFTSAVYPDRLDYVDTVLTACYEARSAHDFGMGVQGPGSEVLG